MGEQAQQDVVRVGISDSRSRGISRRDFIKGAGLVGAAATAAAAAKKLGVFDALQTYPVEQTQHVEIPPWMMSGLGSITISAQAGYGRAQDVDFGTAHVYLETDTDLVIVTAEHIGKGFFWQDLKLNFPNSMGVTHIPIDARVGLKDGPAPKDSDWWIRDFSRASNLELGRENPVRTIYLAKPKGLDSYIVPRGYVLRAGHDPLPGETFAVAGYGSETGELVHSKVTYLRTTKPEDIPDAGISLYEFSGITQKGMSGGAITRSDGGVVALVSRGAVIRNKGMTWGIPFAKYQPLTQVLDVLQKP